VGRILFGSKCTKAQTPLLPFVVDLLYNKLYNKSTTNRSTVVEFAPKTSLLSGLHSDPRGRELRAPPKPQAGPWLGRGM